VARGGVTAGVPLAAVIAGDAGRVAVAGGEPVEGVTAAVCGLMPDEIDDAGDGGLAAEGILVPLEGRAAAPAQEGDGQPSDQREPRHGAMLP
jgi:hypothetical protein